MKRSVLTLVCLMVTLLNAFDTKASKRAGYDDDSLLCLQIEGRINNSDDGENGECSVELICKNKVLESLVLKEGKKRFKFLLEKNAHYAIRVSKKGFITKLIVVNTEMLTPAEGLHLFKFETSLLSEIGSEKLNQDVIDFPVTIIHFDYELDGFTHNMEYTSYIKRELYKSKPVKIQRTKNTQITTELALTKN